MFFILFILTPMVGATIILWIIELIEKNVKKRKGNI